MDTKVLCVEDNANNMEIIRLILRTMGYTVLEAVTGEAGYEMAQRDKPDIVLMDYHLPGMSGLDTTHLFKQDPNLCDVPIIVLTADYDARNAFMKAGCDAYMTKPVRRTNLLRTVNQVLSAQN